MISIRDRGGKQYDLSSVTISPTPEPTFITAFDAKKFGKIEDSIDNDTVNDALQAVISEAEEITKKLFSVRTVVARYNRGDYELSMPYGPVVSVESVQYIESDGTTSLGKFLQIGNVVRLLNYKGGAVVIEYTAGYNDVPAPIKQAVKQAFLTAYEDRQDNVIGTISGMIPTSSRKRLMRYRMY